MPPPDEHARGAGQGTQIHKPHQSPTKIRKQSPNFKKFLAAPLS